MVLTDDITSPQSWLPSIGFLCILELIFKILLVTFKARLGLAPSHMAEMLTPYEPVRSLRSSGGALLTFLKLRLKA